MLHEEAVKLMEAERLLRPLMERKSLPLPVKADICRAYKLIQEAVAYQDDDPPHVMTDDI